jgi:hypothetical protein
MGMAMSPCDVLEVSPGWAVWWSSPKDIHNGCVIEPALAAMAKTFTLKNLPDTPLGAATPTAEEELKRRRALRGRLGPHMFDPDAISVFKREGRP